MKKQCLILGLDSTLIRTFDNDEINEIEKSGILADPKNYELRSRFYDVNINEYIKDKLTITRILGVRRPHLNEFLAYAFNRFNVCVWTAGTYKYGHTIVDNIFKGIGRPIIVYTRENCVGSSGNLEKPVIKMIDENPGLEKYMKMSNTFIIDDRDYSIAPNPSNGILIPAYEPTPTYDSIMQNDERLLQVIEFFDKPEVIESDDIRDLAKHKIFELPTSSYRYPNYNNSKNIVRLI